MLLVLILYHPWRGGVEHLLSLWQAGADINSDVHLLLLLPLSVHQACAGMEIWPFVWLSCWLNFWKGLSVVKRHCSQYSLYGVGVRASTHTSPHCCEYTTTLIRFDSVPPQKGLARRLSVQSIIAWALWMVTGMGPVMYSAHCDALYAGSHCYSCTLYQASDTFHTWDQNPVGTACLGCFCYGPSEFLEISTMKGHHWGDRVYKYLACPTRVLVCSKSFWAFKLPILFGIYQTTQKISSWAR